MLAISIHVEWRARPWRGEQEGELKNEMYLKTLELEIHARHRSKAPRNEAETRTAGLVASPSGSTGTSEKNGTGPGDRSCARNSKVLSHVLEDTGTRNSREALLEKNAEAPGDS